MKVTLTAAMIAALVPVTLSAHHSFAAEWDSKKCRDFTGTLARLDWQNPHPYFFVDVKGASGKVETWSFQAYSPVTLRRNGTDRQVFLDNIGKEVWVRGCVAKNGTPLAAAAGTLKFSDGELRQVGQLQDSIVRLAALAAAGLQACLAVALVAQDTQYKVTPLPPGGAAPRLADGHVDFSGQWFPNGAGQGVSGRFGVDPAALGQFDPKVTPEERPAFQPWALAKIKSMTPTELELSKSSVNCLPRGVPAIWLQNPYTTFILHKPGVMAQLYEVLNNWRVIHLDGRPLPKDPEPFFHGNSAARWEGDTLVVESIGFDERTYIQPNGWFHSEALKVTERYTRPSMNHLIVQITVDDPKVLEKPWTSAPRRWTLGSGEIYEFYCTNNGTLPELEKLRAQELQK